MNAQGQVVGHELFNRSRNHAAHTAASDMMLALTALSHAGVDELMGETLIFVNCTHESLVEGHLNLLDPRRVILEIPPLGHTAAEEVKTRLPNLQALHERGFRLAFNQTVLESAYSAWLPLADFIKIDLSVLPADQVTVLVKYAKRQTEARLIAEKIETAAQQELLSGLGVQLFQGYWLSRPQLVEAHLQFPTQASIDHLMHLVRGAASHQDIANWVKQDAVLSFNLLRLLVTSGICPPDGPMSVEHAVSLLGHNRIGCWTELLQTFRVTSDFTPAPARSAVLCGRYMELLARAQQLPKIVCNQAFMVGLISQLGELLHISAPAISSLLHLPESVRDAVLQQAGYLGALLSLTQTLEFSEEAKVEHAALALRLTTHQLHEARSKAMEWAQVA